MRLNDLEDVMIEWGKPTWGQPGQNVHHAANGSWTEPSEEVED